MINNIIKIIYLYRHCRHIMYYAVNYNESHRISEHQGIRKQNPTTVHKQK
jgi:hypothetical protein